MKNRLLISFFFLCILRSYAQFCGTDEALKYANKAYKDQLEKDKQDYINSILSNSRTTALDTSDIIIPLVVHVIYDNDAYGTGTNIHDTLIYNLVKNLNKRFGPNSTNHLDMHIQFRLACLDPSGNPTTGITRYNGTAIPNYHLFGLNYLDSVSGVSVDDMNTLVGWPTNKYYNIYVVNKIKMAGLFAYFPVTSGYFSNDGIYMRAASFFYGGAAELPSHEMGHAFGLRHTFEGDNSGSSCPLNTNCTTQGDLVCDTPPHISSECGNTGSCEAGSMINSRYNLMSYCGETTSFFTPGQKVRVRTSANYPCRKYTTNATYLVISKQTQSQTKIAGQSVTFSVIATGIGLSYLWKKNGEIIIGAANSSSYTKNNLVLEDSGFYSVDIINTCDTIPSTSAKLTVTGSTTGIRNSSVNSILQVYPNPSANEISLSIQSRQSTDMQISIYDIKGAELYSKDIIASKGEWLYTLDVSSFAKGIYMIRLKDKEGIATDKFIVE